MKRFFVLLTVLTLLTSPSYSADQWAKSEPAGTANISDIDTLVATNNESLDRLVIGYKRGFGINYSSASAISVLAGEAAIPNAAGSIVRWRRATSTTSVGWSDIDTGAEANSTQYYVYLTADTDVTGVVFKISTSLTAPSGSTYYRKIGEFYNDSSGNISRVLSYRSEEGTDYPDILKGWINFNGVTDVINDSYNVSSITDNGMGDYTVVWTTSFSNANYAVSITGNANCYSLNSIATGSVRFYTNSETGVPVDASMVCVLATGDR